MMIRTAGGPIGNPIDFNERKTPLFTRNTWIALGIVGTAHIAVGAALVYQKFELAMPVDTTTRTTVVTIENLPRVKPEEPKPTPPQPQPPNTKVNVPTNVPTTVETVNIATSDTVAVGPTIAISNPAPDPVLEAPPAPPQPQPPSVIRNPSWISQPSGAQLMRAYPNAAIQREIEGSARLNCLVLPNGSVSDCNVISETGNVGFGRAAQSLSRYFRINPRTVNGAAEGSRVDIGIRFNLPD